MSSPWGSPGRYRSPWPTATVRGGAVLRKRWSSIPLIPLLEPRITPVVVTAHLPEALLVLGEQGQTRHPLRALPEVEVRHEQARRATVDVGQRCAVDVPHDPGLAVGE